MLIEIDKLEASTRALKKDWSYLDSFAVPSDSVVDRSAVFFREVRIGAQKLRAYVKIYANKKHPFQRLFRCGRSQKEVRNLLCFDGVGIPIPKIIAWGERRSAISRVVEEFIITESVDQAIPLDSYIREHGLTELQAARTARKIGLWLRKLHQIDFYHKDLHWRNILIHKETSGLKLTFIDCPRGDFHSFGPTRRHWRLKDCATLDKYASVLVSDRARAIFLKSYLNQGCDSSEFKAWVRRIEELRTMRFDQRKGRTKVQPLDTPD